MKGTEIVVSANPTGRKVEGLISGTPKPGTCMQIKTAVEPVGGRHTWEIYNPVAGGSPSLAGDGAPALVAVLDIDHTQGKIFSDAYVSGTRGFIWIPGFGEELNVRKADITGTSSATEDVAIGDRLMIIQGTGFVSKIAVGLVASPVAYPFQSLETLVDQPVETLLWVIFCR